MYVGTCVNLNTLIYELCKENLESSALSCAYHYHKELWRNDKVLFVKINALAALEKGAGLQPFSFQAAPLKAFDCSIKVMACGICHSDIHIINDDWGVSRYPMVPGHEVIGGVVDVGSQVTHLKTGDRVGVGWQQGANSVRGCYGLFWLAQWWDDSGAKHWGDWNG
jgi:Alcohol dehydrogenase GroES-like domain